MKPSAVQRAPEAGDDRVTDSERPPGLLVDDQIGVALAEAGVGVGEAVPLVGHRPHRLGQQLDAVDLDAQLALARGHHRALDADPVAEVELAERGEARRRRPRPWRRTAAPRRRGRRSVAKISLPCSRRSIIRPATVTRASVSVPGCECRRARRGARRACACGRSGTGTG